MKETKGEGANNFTKRPVFINQYAKNRVKTAADPELNLARDRQDTRYDKRTIFASLETVKEDDYKVPSFRVMNMNFAQSMKQHLVLPSCWT